MLRTFLYTIILTVLTILYVHVHDFEVIVNCKFNNIFSVIKSNRSNHFNLTIVINHVLTYKARLALYYNVIVAT